MEASSPSLPFNLFQYFSRLFTPSSAPSPPPPPSPVTIPRAIHEACQLLDLLWSLEGQLIWAEKASCTVKIEAKDDDDDDEAAVMRENQASIRITLGFFNYEARSKFDLHLRLPSSITTATSPLEWVGLTHHYGTIGEEHLADPVRLVLHRSPPHQVIRGIIGAVTEVFEATTMIESK